MKLLAHTFPENARLWSQVIAHILKRYQNAHAINFLLQGTFLLNNILKQCSKLTHKETLQLEGWNITKSIDPKYRMLAV